jgi:hypothetical protein
VSTSDARSLLELLASLKFVTQKEAAKAQLETAIWLWFHEHDSTVVSDPTSIHTLAVAAQGVISTIIADRKAEPSPFMKAVERQPEKVRAWFRNPQNFFKHGRYRDQRKRKYVPHLPNLTELILADNIGTFNRLFRFSSPLLDLFLLRYSLSFPESKISLKTVEAQLVQRVKIEEITKLGRREFFDVVVPLLVEFTAAQRAARSEDSAEI